MKKIFKESPIFGLMLGLCSALAITTSVENAIIMGLSVTLVLIFSNMIISLLRKLIPNNIRIPAYILVISTLVTLLSIYLKEYLPEISNTLGIYIPLIIVNCLILGRAINFASKNNPIKSMKDGLLMGLNYMFSIVLIALVREVLGNGTITIIDKLEPLLNNTIIIKLPNIEILPNNIFLSSAGAFLTLGLLLSIFNGGDINETD